jgi:hypothetical protein
LLYLVKILHLPRRNEKNIQSIPDAIKVFPVKRFFQCIIQSKAGLVVASRTRG